MRSVFIRPSVYVLGTSTTEYGRLLEWLKRADCKSVDYVYGGSNPPSPTKNKSRNWGLVFCVSGGSGFERGEHRSVSRSSRLAQQGVGITPSPTKNKSRNWGLVFCVSGGSGFERGEHRSVSRSSRLAQQGVGIHHLPPKTSPETGACFLR